MNSQSQGFKTVAAIALIGASLLVPTFSQAQTQVGVSVGDRTVGEPAPNCPFPCLEEIKLPLFARTLALAGPEGTYKTDLTRRIFRQQLEGWREHMEVFRRSIELKQFKAPDWKTANVTYLVEVGKYRQFMEAYRAAISMDRADSISYGQIDG